MVYGRHVLHGIMVGGTGVQVYEVGTAVSWHDVVVAVMNPPVGQGTPALDKAHA